VAILVLYKTAKCDGHLFISFFIVRHTTGCIILKPRLAINLFSKTSRPSPGSTQPPIQIGTEDFFVGGMWPGHEADQSLRSIAQF